jgi:hypothetical protein
VLADTGWPLRRAELHLALARLSTNSDPPAAITEARAAHLIYDRLGSPLARASALPVWMGDGCRRPIRVHAGPALTVTRCRPSVPELTTRARTATPS